MSLLLGDMKDLIEQDLAKENVHMAEESAIEFVGKLTLLARQCLWSCRFQYFGEVGQGCSSENMRRQISSSVYCTFCPCGWILAIQILSERFDQSDQPQFSSLKSCWAASASHDAFSDQPCHALEAVSLACFEASPLSLSKWKRYS